MEQETKQVQVLLDENAMIAILDKWREKHEQREKEESRRFVEKITRREKVREQREDQLDEQLAEPGFLAEHLTEAGQNVWTTTRVLIIVISFLLLFLMVNERQLALKAYKAGFMEGLEHELP